MSGIAIVGMACRYPDARSPEELWENVLAQRRAFRRIPDERLRAADYYSPDPAAPDRTYATQAAVIEGWEFDRVRFRVVGSTFRSADLAHWLALEVADAALADAGCAEGEGLPKETTGVLLGNTLTGEFSRASILRLRWPYVRRVVEAALAAEGRSPEERGRFLHELEESYKAPFPPVGEETLAGGLSNTIAGRICNQFDFKGGGYTVDGACAASLLAVITACKSLESGDLDVALAGGVDLSLDPFELVGFAKTGALAPDKMRVYDARSAGFWPGEGCGFLVMMRAEDAVAQGRRIYATVRGWGISSDGSGGITRPTADGQLLALRRAYRRAGFGIDTVVYFEGHGTGTEVGDATELRCLIRALRESGAAGAHATIGTIKANIGHTKAAAGVAGLIKAVMAVHHQVLPPTTGCERPHPELTGDSPPLRVLEMGEGWPAERPHRAAVSAMGFGGINSHVVIEGSAERGAAALDGRTRSLLSTPQDAELFLLAADDLAALGTQVERLAETAARISQAEMADLAAALAIGNPPAEASHNNNLNHSRSNRTTWLASSRENRTSYSRAAPEAGGVCRAAVVASTPSELADRLRTLAAWLAEGRASNLNAGLGIMLGAPAGAPRIGLLFTGQGSPAHLGGGAWRRRFDFVDELYIQAALPAGGDSVATEVAQPAIVTASAAGLAALERLGVTGVVAVGHSLGELTALFWGGAYDRDALLRIARARGRAMADLRNPTGGMAGLRAGRDEVERLIAGEAVVIAGLNSPRQTVVSGESEAIAAVLAKAKAKGLRAVRLAVSHAFHSPLVAAATPALREHLAREEFRPLRRSVVSTITGGSLSAEEDLREILCRQVTSPVRFMEALNLAAKDVDLWIEVGPGEVLRGLAAESLDQPIIATDAGGPSLRGLLLAVGAAYVLGAPVDREALFAGRCVKPFDIDRHPVFLMNPCEQAPIVEGETASDAAEGGGRERGYPPAKAGGSGAKAGGFGTRAEGAGAAAISPGATPLEVVRQLVAERTELPVSAVRDDSRLLSNLHLNSITVGHLVVESARRLGLAPPIAPTDYADATVAGVALALEELRRTGGAASGTDEKRAPPGVDAWIRPFTVELVERPLPHRQPPAPVSGWQVLAPPGYPLKDAIESAFARGAFGGGVVLCLPPQPGEECIGLMLEAARAGVRSRCPSGPTYAGIAPGILAPEAPRFVLVQHGGGGAAFARTLHLERPRVATCVVDVPVDHPPAAEWILAEAMAAVDYREAHYDAAGRRRVPRLRILDDCPLSHGPLAGESHTGKMPVPQESLESPLPLGPHDVLLVTGGGKGIAAECALGLAKECGVRLGLLGRSKPTADAELAANLERMAKTGVTFEYVSADVTDAEQTRVAVLRIEAALGPITAVLHGAGANVPQLLTSLDEAAFMEIIKPKLHGLRHVLAAVKPDRLSLLVAFGSIIARMGLPGEAHYATANDWLAEDVDRWQRRHPHCRCLTLEWSVWSGVGMGYRLGRVDVLAQQGVTPIPTDEGLRQFRRLLAQPTPSRVVVTGRFGDPPTLSMEERELPLRRFVEHARVDYPGVELIVDVDLSGEGDPYLGDHVFSGTRLFPAVMGLEAMAQVAMTLTGAAEPPIFENVRFNRPVGVPDGASETIRLAALVQAPGRVEVVLRCRQTAFQVDHFSATCLFESRESPEAGREPAVENDADPQPSSRVLLDPERDLYGGILFHKGRFRRLRGYRRLMATECLAEISPGEGAPWFGRYLPVELVLGDPGARDASVHAIQPCIPHARILPVGVDRVRISLTDVAGPRFVSARERTREGDLFIYDLVVTRADGVVCERWEGLRLQVVEGTGPPETWIEPLLGPYLERRLGELISGTGVRVFVERLAAADRRAQSNHAIQQLLGMSEPVRYRPDGKPDAAPDGRAVSAAHAGELTLAVAGSGPLGCDVEPVAVRSAQTWRDLLGVERHTLAEVVARQTNEFFENAATRVWSAGECLKKAGAAVGGPLLFDAAAPDGWVLLRSGELVVATLVARVRGAEAPLVFAALTRSPS